MKARFAVVGVAVWSACTPDLTGDLSLTYQDDTSTLLATFAPHEGRRFDPGTVFLELNARGADVSRTNTAASRVCLDLPADGELEIPIRDLAYNGSITGDIWFDQPTAPDDAAPGTPDPAPRPCAGTNIVSDTFSNTGTAPTFTGALEHPEWITICEDPGAVEVRFRNTGTGPLELKSVDMTPVGMVTLAGDEMPEVLDKNGELRLAITIDAQTSAEHGILTVETDDPVDPIATIPVTITKPRLATDQSRVQLGPDQTQVRIPLRNLGCGALGDVEVELTALHDDETSVLDEINVVGCGDPCVLDNPSVITLRYDDVVETERAIARLRIKRVDDPTNVVDLTVIVDDQPCLPVTPTLTSTSTALCVGRNVTLDGHHDLGVNYAWRVRSGGPLEIQDLGGGLASFTPDRAAVYVIEVDVQNECGAWSDEAALDSFVITDTCPD